MFFKKTATLALVIGAISAWGSVARADGWIMLGPRDWKPDNGVALGYSTFAGGVRTTSPGYVYAPMVIPFGKTITSFFCQLFDRSDANAVTVQLIETYSDDTATIGTRAPSELKSNTGSAGAGHAKYGAGASLLIKSFDNAPNGAGSRYYTYGVRAYLDGTQYTGVKSCAIYYSP